MKKYIKIILAALLTAALSACNETAPSVSETSGTAFENHTIMPKIVDAEEETERESTATDFDGDGYDDDDYETRENDEYEYEVYTDHIVLTDYLGDEAVVEIPAEIDGLKVTEIGEWAFPACDEFESVTLSNGIEKIGRCAFVSCKSLTKIEIPESVAEIGDMAFVSCDELKSVTLPDGIEKIGELAFGRCKSLTKIEIPESVTEIGDSAFYECTELAEISIPENAEIGDGAFYYTAWIENQPQPLIINSKLFLWDTAEGDVVIPDGITRICMGAFFNCSKMTSVAIPESVKGIGESAFEDCSLLKSVTIPESVTVLGEGAFSSCENLADVTVPDHFDEETTKAAFEGTPWYKENFGE